MDPLSILLWILAGLGGLVLIAVVALYVVCTGVLIFGFRLMRDEEAAQLPGRSDR